MRVGIVHTHGAPCWCHETIEAALRLLGHVPVDCDSEAVEERALELARLDLVFDQTDTYRGEGRRRPVVAEVLERAGARRVGSGAAACVLADDKGATKARWRAAGVPVPEGGPVAVPGAGAALDLPYPRVVKPVHEHMSRGLALVRDGAEERAALAAGPGPWLVERYVEGRELGVTVLGNPSCGTPLRLLPIVEYPLAPGERVLGFGAKRHGPEPVPAALAEAAAARIAGHAAAAFEALGLADWVRFDVRLDPEGRPFFLEANTKPSLERSSPALVSAAAAGMTPADLVHELMDLALARHADRDEMERRSVLLLKTLRNADKRG